MEDFSSEELFRIQNAATSGDPCPYKGGEAIYEQIKQDVATAPKGVMVDAPLEMPGDTYDELIDDFFASWDNGELDDDSPDDTKAGDNTPSSDTEAPPVEAESGKTNE